MRFTHIPYCLPHHKPFGASIGAQELPRLSRERCAAAAVTLQRQIFMLGGCDEESCWLS